LEPVEKRIHALQVKNKYLKESKVNGKRMTDAMLHKRGDVDALREVSEHLKSEAEASASGVSPDTGADTAAAAAWKAPCLRPGSRTQHFDSGEDVSCSEGEILNPLARDFLY
jgi:hypothetical protein